MSYAVKEMFLTLQGEGVQAGRRAVFIRFAGCNLWSGREQDRATAVCRFCDTDFVGMNADGGRFADAEIGALSEEELTQFEALIEVPDRDLFRWLTGEDATPENYDTAVYRRLKAFHRHDAPIHN